MITHIVHEGNSLEKTAQFCEIFYLHAKADNEFHACYGVGEIMDPRIGQRIVRDRWGEPISPLPPDPEPLKSKWLVQRIFNRILALFPYWRR